MTRKKPHSAFKKVTNKRYLEDSETRSLIERVRANNDQSADSFNRLFENFLPLIHAHARRVLGIGKADQHPDYDQLLSAFSETFWKVVHRYNLEGDISFISYLLSCLMKNGHTYHRNKNNRDKYHLTVSLAEANGLGGDAYYDLDGEPVLKRITQETRLNPIFHPKPHEPVSRETCALIDQILDEMAPKKVETLRMAYGLTPGGYYTKEQIAGFLKTSVGTIAARWGRSLHEIKESKLAPALQEAYLSLGA